MRQHAKYERLIEAAKRDFAAPTRGGPPVRRDFAHRGARGCRARNDRADPCGPSDKIRLPRRQAGSISPAFEIVDAPHSQAAAEKAVELVREGKAELLMKGSLHSDELLAAVAKRETGLRTGRRISHVFIMDVPTHPETLFITDAAVNIFPDLMAKRDIVQNAIDLQRASGSERRKVAILSAVETVTSPFPRTIEAAALCKMADRGQITGGDPRRPACLRQCHQPRGGRDQGHQVAGRRPGADPGRAGPRGRQHAGKEPVVPVQGGCGGHRARRPRPGHPDIARRQREDAAGIVRRRLPARA